MGADLTRHPTVYVYTTDGGPIRFLHVEGYSIDRPAVKAGGIRFNRGMVEQHEVESLSEIPSEYLRIELKTEPLELPPHERVAALKMPRSGSRNPRVSLTRRAGPLTCPQ